MKITKEEIQFVLDHFDCEGRCFNQNIVRWEHTKEHFKSLLNKELLRQTHCTYYGTHFCIKGEPLRIRTSVHYSQLLNTPVEVK